MSNTTDLQVNAGNTFSLTPTTLDEAMKFSELIANSDICPKDFKGKSGNVLVAVQMGAELGLPPLQAIQNIAVINGRPSIWGDALMAIAQASPSKEYIKEWFDEETMTAYCEAKRKGEAAHTESFSQKEAQNAQLWGKNVWKAYPKRMLKMRARGFCLRDVFTAELKGIQLAEEQQDIVSVSGEVVSRSPAKSNDPLTNMVDGNQSNPKADLESYLDFLAGCTTPACMEKAKAKGGELHDSVKKEAQEAFTKKVSELKAASEKPTIIENGAPSYPEISAMIMKASSPDDIDAALGAMRHLSDEFQVELSEMADKQKAAFK